MNHVTTIQEWRLILLVGAVLTLARLSHGFSSCRLKRAPGAGLKIVHRGRLAVVGVVGTQRGKRCGQDARVPRGMPEGFSPRDVGGGWHTPEKRCPAFQGALARRGADRRANVPAPGPHGCGPGLTTTPG